MDFSKIRVLLTDGGGRQTLTILRGLKEIGCHVTVLCTSKLAVCYVSKFADKRILDDRASSFSPEYIDFITELVKSGDYDVLLAVAEMTTDKITLNEDELSKYVKIAAAPRKAYIKAFDKQQTFELAIETGMPCPKTRRIGQSVEEYLETVSFPLIIKPRNGVGSIGFHKFKTFEEFYPYLEEHNINLDDYVLQEFIDYDKRLGAVLLVDHKGNLCTAYADEILRWYPIDAGTATTVVIIDDDEMIAHSYSLLKAMGWQGLAALSFMRDKRDGLPKLCEINGRVPASIKLSMLLGYNVAKQLIEIAYEADVTRYPANKKFGVMTRHSQAEWAWFIHAKDRFTCKPSWFSWKNTKDVVFWPDDPLPYFAYTISQLAQYKRKMKLRRH